MLDKTVVKPGSFPEASSDKSKLRLIFVERAERPTYDELAAEYGVPVNTIKNWAADEGWQRLRIANQEKLAEKSDALAILLRATSIDQRLVEGFSNDIFLAQEKIARCLDDIDDKKATSSRASTINTLTFALKNLAETARACGIVGVPKGLARDGKEDNGRFNPQTLIQINGVVESLKTKYADQQVAAHAADPVAPTAEKAADPTPNP